MSMQLNNSFIPVYDDIPEDWNSARQTLVEYLKQITNGVNLRDVGYLLEEPIITGKLFQPSALPDDNTSPQQFRQIFRVVVNIGPLMPGLNPGVNHGITFDSNFTLVQLWVSGTNTTTFTARTITGHDVLMNATQIVITSPQAFDRSWCVIEFLLEQ